MFGELVQESVTFLLWTEGASDDEASLIQTNLGYNLLCEYLSSYDAFSILVKICYIIAWRNLAHEPTLSCNSHACFQSKGLGTIWNDMQCRIQHRVLDDRRKPWAHLLCRNIWKRLSDSTCHITRGWGSSNSRHELFSGAIYGWFV